MQKECNDTGFTHLIDLTVVLYILQLFFSKPFFLLETLTEKMVLLLLLEDILQGCMYHYYA